MLRGQFCGDLLEAHDRQPVADLPQMRRRAVQLDHLRSGPAENHIGFKPLAVVDVADQNPFVGQESGLLRQVLGHGEAAFVMEARAGDGGAMQLRFEERIMGHRHQPYHTEQAYSISRMRSICRPPSKAVSRNSRTHSSAMYSEIIRWPMAMTFASLCLRPSWAVCEFQA